MFVLNNNSIYIEKEENYLCSRDTMMTSIWKDTVINYKNKYPGQDKFCTIGTDHLKEREVLSLKGGVFIPISSARILNLFKEADCFPYLLTIYDKANIKTHINIKNTSSPLFPDNYIGVSFCGFRIDSVKRVTLSIIGDEIKEPKKELLHNLYFWGWYNNHIELDNISYKDIVNKGYGIQENHARWKGGYYIIDAKVIKEYEPSDDTYNFIPKTHLSDSVFLYEEGKRIVYGIKCLQKNLYIKAVKGIRVPKVIIPFDSKQFVCKIKIRSFKCDYQISINENIVEL